MLLKIRVHAAARRRPRLLRTGGDIWYEREVVIPDGNQSTIALDVDGQPGNRSIVTLESPRRAAEAYRSQVEEEIHPLDRKPVLRQLIHYIQSGAIT